MRQLTPAELHYYSLMRQAPPPTAEQKRELARNMQAAPPDRILILLAEKAEAERAKEKALREQHIIPRLLRFLKSIFR